MSKKVKSENIVAHHVLGELERLARLVRAASHTKGLTPAQWDILRFVAKANRFSNSPIAASHYVGATKGTTSQSIASLVAKGLLSKLERKGDQRSVSLQLSEAGHALLATDPLKPLEGAIGQLGDKTLKRFAKGVSEVLAFEHVRQQQPSFGGCGTCRFYRSSPDYCMKFAEDLQAQELKLICVEHIQR
jgi:DNA-binding MarR family transcriptional regulator